MIRVGGAVCVCLASACVRYPAFDEYRTIRQGEPVSVQSSSKDGLQTIRTPNGGTIQAIPVGLRIESTVTWTTYVQQVSAERLGTRPGLSGKMFFLVGAERLNFDSTRTVLRSGGPYLFPYVERDRYARADFTWGRDAALARGLERVLDAAGADPETKARRLAGIAPAVTLSEYERRVDPNWRFGASSFLVLGLDAVSRTPVAAAGGAQPRPEIIPADSLARPVDENTWPFETVDDVAYPIAPSALPGAFRRIRFVTGFELDSLRILGNWYSATDPLVWRARPIRDVTPSPVTGEANLETLLPAAGADIGAVFRVHEARLVEALDVVGARSARVLLACWDPKAPHAPCFSVGQEYELRFVAPRPDNSSQFVPTSYNFRLLQRSWPVSFMVGTGLIFLFLGASAY